MPPLVLVVYVVAQPPRRTANASAPLTSTRRNELESISYFSFSMNAETKCAAWLRGAHDPGVRRPLVAVGHLHAEHARGGQVHAMMGIAVGLMQLLLLAR
jgi:hypothetical protein